MDHLKKEDQLSNPEQELRKKFYDIINSEDWNLNYDARLPNIDEVKITEVPLGNILMPTPLPGIWLHLNMGFEVEIEDDNLW